MVLGENREVARSAAEAMINDFCQWNGTFIMDVNVRVQEWNAFAAGIMKEYLVYISLKVDDYGSEYDQFCHTMIYLLQQTSCLFLTILPLIMKSTAS